MARHTAIRSGAGHVLAVFVSLLPLRALPASSPQDAGEPCLVCHADSDITSSAGIPVFVDPDVFSGSVHGRSGRGCVGCHADLAGSEDFPHAVELRPVACVRCHPDYGRTALDDVHGLPSPRLVAKPVLCRDCHGHHDILPSSEPRSTLHVANRPQACAVCHPGAGPNYSRGRVHELDVNPGSSPTGVVRNIYRILTGLVAVFFIAYVSADLLRRRREP